jgi:hypothetical protein
VLPYSVHASLDVRPFAEAEAECSLLRAGALAENLGGPLAAVLRSMIELALSEHAVAPGFEVMDHEIDMPVDVKLGGRWQAPRVSRSARSVDSSTSPALTSSLRRSARF